MHRRPAEGRMPVHPCNFPSSYVLPGRGHGCVRPRARLGFRPVMDRKGCRVQAVLQVDHLCRRARSPKHIRFCRILDFRTVRSRTCCRIPAPPQVHPLPDPPPSRGRERGARHAAPLHEIRLFLRRCVWNPKPYDSWKYLMFGRYVQETLYRTGFSARTPPILSVWHRASRAIQ